MRKDRRVRLSTLAVLAAFASATFAATPQAVSPGGADAFEPVHTACPTFSWSASEGAKGYEVLVYEVPETEALATLAVSDSLETPPRLRRTITAGALSWTPSANECLEMFGRYAWAVRELEPQAPWSESRMFRVDPDPLVRTIAGVLEEAMAEYLEERGLSMGPPGELSGLIARELERRPGAATSSGADETTPYRGGRQPLTGSGPIPRGVFTDDVELTLTETGSGPSDKVQLVFETPEFDGDPADAWAIIVEAEDTADPDDGKMFFSTPSFFDALQLFTDGTAIIGDLREFRILPSTGPPIGCSSFLQEGMMYWDSSVNTLCVCDGTSWKPVDSDTMASCS